MAATWGYHKGFCERGASMGVYGAHLHQRLQEPLVNLNSGSIVHCLAYCHCSVQRSDPLFVFELRAKFKLVGGLWPCASRDYYHTIPPSCAAGIPMHLLSEAGKRVQPLVMLS